MGGIRPRGAGGTRWRFIPNLVMVFYSIGPELFTDPAIVTYPTIESLYVRKMIRLNLLCLMSLFFPSQFRRGLKKRDHAISKVSIVLYILVLPLNDAELKLQIALKIQDIRDAKCFKTAIRLSECRSVSDYNAPHTLVLKPKKFEN